MTIILSMTFKQVILKLIQKILTTIIWLKLTFPPVIHNQSYDYMSMKNYSVKAVPFLSFHFQRATGLKAYFKLYLPVCETDK